MNKIIYNENQLLIKDDENYIIINNGEIVKQNIDNNIVITNEKNYQIDICNNNRSLNEENIIKYAPSVILVNINKTSDLKVVNINDVESFSNVVINVSDNVQANIYDINFSSKNIAHSLLEIICQENSNVVYSTIQKNENQLNSLVNIYVCENVNLNINSLSLNDLETNNCINVYMHKQFATVNVNNSIINNSSKVQGYEFNMYHLDKNSKSTLTNYAICKDNSVLNINSNGIIAKGCSKSKIYQKSKGIILDLTSAISANPLLQIDEFDVEANHGASIGAIDDEDLYYLMSRGLTKAQSEHLIVGGFMEPIIKELDDELVKNYALYLIAEKLK